MFGSRRRRVLIGLVAGMLAATAACSSQGGAQKNAAPGGGDMPRLTIAMVTHAPPGDAFWAQIQKAKAGIVSGKIKVPDCSTKGCVDNLIK